MKTTKKRLLALMLAFMMIMSNSVSVFADDVETMPQPLPFNDVAETAWYYPHVRAVWENNLFNGTSPTTFHPQGTMTRAMFVQFLANIDSVDLTTYRTIAPIFEDSTNSTAWYYAAVQWAAEHGITHTLNPNTFEPNRAITREEMSVMLYNYIAIMDIDFSQPQNELPQFTDQASISEWAVYAVRAIQAAGIITGYPGGSFQPNNQSTRAEVATIFARYLEVLAEITNDKDEENEEEETEYFTLNIANITGQGNRYGTVTIVNRNTTTYDFPTGTGVTVRATAASGYVFDGWFGNVGGTGTAISRSSSHTFTINADTNLFARFRATPQDTGNGGNGAWTPPPAAFVAVTSITKSSALTATVGTPLTLSATTNPTNATNRNIVWSVQNAGGTGATITSGNVLNTTGAGTVTIRATITNGATATTNFTQDFTITVTAAPPPFVAVTGITMTSTNTVQEGTPLTLTATVAPNNATNQTITWSVQNAGGTGATITSGNVLNTTGAGTVTVRATITNGATATTNFTQDFTITVTAAPPPFVAVTGITMTSANTVQGGMPLTLTATVAPNNATNQTITWSVQNAGTTGATITSGNILNTTAVGAVIVRATITNGAMATTNFTQDFTITVTAAPPPFVAVTGITMTSSTTGTVGTPITLAGTVIPTTATNQTIVWSLGSGSTAAGASVTGGQVSATGAGIVNVVATIVNGATATTDFTANFTITFADPFVAVTNITMTSANTVQAYIPLMLTASVTPNNANNQTVIWSVENAGGTGATISGNVLNTTAAGTVVVRATITNGQTATTDFTQDFSIAVTAPQTPSEALTAALAALAALPVSNATTQVDIMAAVEGAITNPDIQALWATSGLIFNLTPATTTAPGHISGVIHLMLSPPIIDDFVIVNIPIPQLP